MPPSKQARADYLKQLRDQNKVALFALRELGFKDVLPGDPFDHHSLYLCVTIQDDKGHAKPLPIMKADRTSMDQEEITRMIGDYLRKLGRRDYGKKG